jgi:hypothetical protein
LLVGVGGVVGGEKPELEDEIGAERIADQRKIAGSFERVVELGVGPVGIDREGFRKQAAVGDLATSHLFLVLYGMDSLPRKRVVQRCRISCERASGPKWDKRASGVRACNPNRSCSLTWRALESEDFQQETRYLC